MPPKKTISPQQRGANARANQARQAKIARATAKGRATRARNRGLRGRAAAKASSAAY